MKFLALNLTVNRDNEDDEWICRARHKQSSDALSISQTGAPSDVDRTSLRQREEYSGSQSGW